MNEHEAGQYWENNAEAWTALARAGYDVYRDHLNTPGFFSILPRVHGLHGLDIGCGEGHNTRLLASEGATLHAIDISPTFIQHAQSLATAGITYITGSATLLPFSGDTFDFATSFMCMMDFPDPFKALQEAYRVLKPGGFFQFSITHPCFATPHRKNLRDGSGKTYAVEVGDYFTHRHGRIDEWTFGAAPSGYAKFKVPLFNMTLTEWVDGIIQAGFILEKVHEPKPDDETVKNWPALQDAQVVAYFLHFRCRKPLVS